MLEINLEKFVLEFYHCFERIYEYDSIFVDKGSKVYKLDKKLFLKDFKRNYPKLSWLTIEIKKDYILNVSKVSDIPKEHLQEPFLKERNVFGKEYYIIIGNGEHLYCPDQNKKEVKQIVEIFKNYEAYLRKQKLKKL